MRTVNNINTLALLLPVSSCRLFFNVEIGEHAKYRLDNGFSRPGKEGRRGGRGGFRFQC